jgi:hypothetical protein
MLVQGGANGENGHGGLGMLGMLMNLLVAEKSGLGVADTPEAGQLRELADRLSRQAMDSLGRAADVPVPTNGN